jgi:hypothetical protein
MRLNKTLNLDFCPVYSSKFRVNCIGVHDLRQCPDFNPGLDCGFTSNTRIYSIHYRVYCIGVHDLRQCPDFNPGLDCGFTSNTKVFKLGSMINIVHGTASENTGKQLCCLSGERQYTLSNILIRSNLGKNAIKTQKYFIFKIFENSAKLSAGALRRAGDCHKIFSIDFSQENYKIFQKNFDINFENSMSKTAIRMHFRGQGKKLGQENQFLQNSRRKIQKYMPCREGNRKHKPCREGNCTRNCHGSTK